MDVDLCLAVLTWLIGFVGICGFGLWWIMREETRVTALLGLIASMLVAAGGIWRVLQLWPW